MRRLWSEITQRCILPVVAMTRRGILVDQKEMEELRDVVGWERQAAEEKVVALATMEAVGMMPPRPLIEACVEHPEFVGATAKKKCPRCKEIWTVVREWRTSKAFKKAVMLQDFNPGSREQLAWLLHTRLGLPVKSWTDTGRAQVTVGTLEWLIESPKTPEEHLPLLRALLSLSHLQKRLDEDLAPPIQSDGRVHPHYTLEGTAIGRLRSGRERYDEDKTTGEAFNMHNPHRETRGIYVAPPGKVLVEIDAAQVEWVMMMLLAGCERGVELYDAGADIHGENAKDVVAPMLGKDWGVMTKEERKAIRTYPTKSFTHGVDYGEGDPNLSRRLGIKRAEAKRGRKLYLSKWPEIEEWHKGVEEAALRDKMLRTPFGRMRRFLDVTTAQRGGKRILVLNRDAFKEAAAFGPASMNGDIWKGVLVELHAAGIELVTGLHDSFVFEAPEEGTRQTVERAYEICRRPVEELEPLAGKKWAPRWEVKVGKRWGATMEEWVVGG